MVGPDGESEFIVYHAWDPKMKARLANLGLEPLANSPAEFGNYIVQYTEKWGKVVRAANIKPD